MGFYRQTLLFTHIVKCVKDSQFSSPHRTELPTPSLRGVPTSVRQPVLMTVDFRTVPDLEKGTSE